jgi:hypothetical protein
VTSYYYDDHLGPDWDWGAPWDQTPWSRVEIAGRAPLVGAISSAKQRQDAVVGWMAVGPLYDSLHQLEDALRRKGYNPFAGGTQIPAFKRLSDQVLALDMSEPRLRDRWIDDSEFYSFNQALSAWREWIASLPTLGPASEGPSMLRRPLTSEYARRVAESRGEFGQARGASFLSVWARVGHDMRTVLRSQLLPPLVGINMSREAPSIPPRVSLQTPAFISEGTRVAIFELIRTLAPRMPESFLRTLVTGWMATGAWPDDQLAAWIQWIGQIAGRRGFVGTTTMVDSLLRSRPITAAASFGFEWYRKDQWLFRASRTSSGVWALAEAIARDVDTLPAGLPPYWRRFVEGWGGFVRTMQDAGPARFALKSTWTDLQAWERALTAWKDYYRRSQQSAVAGYRPDRAKLEDIHGRPDPAGWGTWGRYLATSGEEGDEIALTPQEQGGVRESEPWEEVSLERGIEALEAELEDEGVPEEEFEAPWEEPEEYDEEPLEDGEPEEAAAPEAPGGGGGGAAETRPPSAEELRELAKQIGRQKFAALKPRAPLFKKILDALRKGQRLGASDVRALGAYGPTVQKIVESRDVDALTRMAPKLKALSDRQQRRERAAILFPSVARAPGAPARAPFGPTEARAPSREAEAETEQESAEREARAQEKRAAYERQKVREAQKRAAYAERKRAAYERAREMEPMPAMPIRPRRRKVPLVSQRMRAIVPRRGAGWGR